MRRRQRLGTARSRWRAAGGRRLSQSAIAVRGRSEPSAVRGRPELETRVNAQCPGRLQGPNADRPRLRGQWRRARPGLAAIWPPVDRRDAEEKRLARRPSRSHMLGNFERKPQTAIDVARRHRGGGWQWATETCAANSRGRHLSPERRSRDLRRTTCALAIVLDKFADLFDRQRPRLQPADQARLGRRADRLPWWFAFGRVLRVEGAQPLPGTSPQRLRSTMMQLRRHEAALAMQKIDDALERRHMGVRPDTAVCVAVFRQSDRRSALRS